MGRNRRRWPWLPGCNFRFDGTWETALKGLLWGGVEGLTQGTEILEAFLEVSPVFETACLTDVEICSRSSIPGA